jgi:sulfur-oxidizing protein SoxX
MFFSALYLADTLFRGRQAILRIRGRVATWLCVLGALGASSLSAQSLLQSPDPSLPKYPPLEGYKQVGDSVPKALGGRVGDAREGGQIVTTRLGQCTLCHSVPNFQGHVGNLGPALSGVGARLSSAQLRLRIINESLVNPSSIMPAFYKIDSLVNVDPIWAGQPILNAQQIEDVVAYLATLQ